MAKDRDDFSKPVKMELAGRAGWICSFPDCNQPTAGPAKESKNKSINNGVAAHIAAAASGGPRYDSLMTREERSDISNGIWMCPTHGNLIDKEDRGYTVEQIRGWKVEAENRAARNLELGQSASLNSTVSRYSEKDKKILSEYGNILSYETIRLIQNDPFEKFVKDEVIFPVVSVFDMEDNPRFKFQDPFLENLRQTLNSQAKALRWHFAQQSGPGTDGYAYIDLVEYERQNPGSWNCWEREIEKTQKLAAEFCSTAMQLLEIKENN